jgi:hypothetical protein
VKGVLDALDRRLLSQRELFGGGGRRLRFGCRSHVDFLVLLGNPFSCGGRTDRRGSVGSDSGGADPHVSRRGPTQPQQSFWPSATLMLFTPAAFLSVTKATPVS